MKLRPLIGRIRVVPDKSLTHRGVLLGALAKGETFLRDPNPGADCRATLSAVESLGAPVQIEPDGWRIRGSGSLREPEEVLDLGNSGTGLRLLAGLLAPRPFLSILTGDRSLRSRPMGRVIEPLRSMGARIDARQGARAPLAIRGGPLAGIDYLLPVASAQVKSALLLAGLALESGEVRVREPGPSRDHTERLLAWLGAPLRREPGAVTLSAGADLEARSWSVPGDVSAAAFYLVAAAITPGSRISIEGVGLNPTRTGGLDALRRMGARLTITPDPETGPEPTGTLRMESSELRPVHVVGSEAPRLIDEVPVLAVAAAFARGESHFEGMGELRVKESDRIASTCALLRAVGVEVEEQAEGFRVHGTGGAAGGLVETHDDHRIAMAALVAGCAASGEVRVDSSRMVGTSDPGFAERLEILRGGEA